MSLATITTLHKQITQSILTIEPSLTYDEIREKFIELCNALHDTETDETVWSIGEFDHATLDDLIIGAFWHYSEWHTGQFSPEYMTYCVLGTIYSPNMECAPENSEDSGFDVYHALAGLASNQR